MPDETTLRRLIKKIAMEQNYHDYELIINEISSGGANYTSKLYSVTIKEHDKKNLHLFGKVASFGEKHRCATEGWKIYSTEQFFYTKLTKTYKAIEDVCDVPKEHRLEFSKYYGSDPSLYEETLVLEDLTATGWRVYDRFKSIDWAYATSAVTEMAKLHALSFAYSKMNPEEHEQVIADIQFEYNGSPRMTRFIRATAKVAMNKVRQENKEVLKNYLKEYESSFRTHTRPIKCAVIIHGDYRPSNLMQKTREDGTVDIKIVDLQTLQGASPVIDLLYFIFTGSDEQFRAQYYDKLIDHYYTQLAAAMKRLHLDPDKIYSRADFDAELKEKLPFGLTIAVFSLPVVTVAAEDAPKVNEDMDITSFSIDKTSDLYTERLNGVVNDYVKWGVLK